MIAACIINVWDDTEILPSSLWYKLKHKNFDHFKYSLRVNKKNIFG